MKGAARYILLLAVTAMLLTACGDDTPDEMYTNYRKDLVTVAATEGGVTRFTYHGRGDSAAVTLRAATGDVKLNAGDRVVLRYGTGMNTPLQGTVDVKYYYSQRVALDTLKVTERNATELPSDAVKLRSLWRAGPYLNVYCQLEYTGKAHTLALLADQATWASDTVTCRLVHDLNGAEPMQWRDTYASYRIDVVPATCRVLAVHTTDVIRPGIVYLFEL